MVVNLHVKSDFRSMGLIVVPPPSPSDTNPPLGPALLARAAARHGVDLGVADLNIAHINRFRCTARRRPTAALGDHGKDRPLVATAAQNLFAQFGLAGERPAFLPPGDEPAQGMHYSFEALERRLSLSAKGGDLAQWLQNSLFSRPDWPPRVLGVSLMGPSQVFVGLLLLELVKRRHPSVTTVLGGSHVTLLMDQIRVDARYQRHVDIVMPGHCEEAFARLLAGDDSQSTRISGAQSLRGPDGPSFEYLPLFDGAHLAMYPREQLTLPVQFTRGCVYGRCTFCTYPRVEPVTTDLFEEQAADAMTALTDTHGVNKFSLKDSLVTAPMMERLAGALLARRHSVEWSATTKVNRRLTRLAPLLARSGLRTVELGVETISPRGQTMIDKRARLVDIEDVILALSAEGITVIVNLVFGLPGETLAEAEQQLAWLRNVREAANGHVDYSLNALQVVRGSPMAEPPSGIELNGIAPWAYSYVWERPSWVVEFAGQLTSLELADPFAEDAPSAKTPL
ncbi:B12-binding domain-containing radical SAM protein [Streptomyces sp. NPDC087903]|uniref:B12-binding domain-containing radical SAM protein n=1 Tax=Streptomyces sp. NPDC087903 TaxID=3365819 RepID=UPI00381B7650